MTIVMRKTQKSRGVQAARERRRRLSLLIKDGLSEGWSAATHQRVRAGGGVSLIFVPNREVNFMYLLMDEIAEGKKRGEDWKAHLSSQVHPMTSFMELCFSMRSQHMKHPELLEYS